MGFLVPVVAVVVGAVTTVVATVGTLLVSLVGAIIAAIVSVGSAVLGALAGVITGTLAGLGVISEFCAANVLQSLGLLNTVSIAAYAMVAPAVAAVATTFQALLSAIHFKTLMAIHNIAMLVSKDYRKAVNKMYTDIARYSQALNLGASFIPLALENARNLVLDVSAMMGRSYDLGQVVWLKELETWAKKAAAVGKRYENQPALILSDIDTWITKPNVDAKATLQQHVLSTIENVIDLTERIVKDVVKVKTDLEKFVHDLPEFIRKDIEPRLKAVTKYIDDFIVDIYQPNMSTLKQIAGILQTDAAKEKQKLQDLANRLRRPGDYISEIYQLPAYEWLGQEKQITDVVNRYEDPYVHQAQESTSAISSELQRIAETLKREIAQVAWYVPEIEAPVLKAIEDIEKLNTWFVGDY